MSVSIANTLREILTPAHVLNAVNASSKKKVLQTTSEVLVTHLPDLYAQDVLDSLNEREKIGSTYIGNGIALPHARMAELDYPVTALLSLKKPMDWGNLDQEMIDIVFALIVPDDSAEQHLEILAAVAEAFKDKGFRNCLLHATSNDDLYQKAIDYYG